MSIYRAQISLQMDTEFPRDAISVNPHYDGTNPQALANALKTLLLAHPSVGAAQAFKVKVYDAEKLPPSYPLAESSNVVAARSSGAPREVALCLSYYSGFNRPRLRGRMYIPATILGGNLAQKPSQVQIDAALSWKDIFTVGSATAIWVLWSRREKKASVVDHIWCDNEWDTIRSRGMDSTARTALTLSQP